MICPALPSELTADIARMAEDRPAEVDLSEQTLPGLGKRYLLALQREADLRDRFNLARLAPDRIEAIYQRVRALHPVECGGAGEEAQ